MARIRVNDACNVVTLEHSTAYRRSDGTPPAPQITVPGYSMRLSIESAEWLAQCLTEAVARARKEEQKA